MAEKTLNELPRDLRVLCTKGNDALARENFDYAIDLYNQVLSQDPSIYECRKMLRAAQIKKAGSGGGIFKKMWSTASSSPLVGKAQISLRKDPAEALKIAEQILNSDPQNAAAHRVIVEAAAALDLPRTGVLSLEMLFINSPKDRDVAIRFANLLADTGDVGKAERILSDLHDSFPADQELSQALKNISARKTMEKGGYDALADGQGSYRDILKDKNEAVTLEQENKVVKSEDTTDRLIREYEGRVKAEPNNLKTVRSLAELYSQRKEFDKALGLYGKIKTTEAGNDPSLDRAIAETTMKKYEAQIAALDVNAPDFSEKLAQFEAEKKVYQVEECKKRAERFPTDLQIRFDLGVLYFQAGKIGEAIAEFQKAQGNPHRRIQAMSYLGQAFAKRNMDDMAARKFQEAIKEKLVFDEEKKELHYQLGTIFEKMKKREEAMEQFKIIYEADIGYKDVEAKVNAYYAGT